MASVNLQQHPFVAGLDPWEIELDRIFQRVAVRPPYFSLDRLRYTADGLLTARIPLTELPCGPDGAIRPFSAARHLANLGLAAAALSGESTRQCIYLPHRMEINRLAIAAPATIWGRQTFTGQVDYVEVERRKARALTRLWSNDGQALYTLETSYHVVQADMLANQSSQKFSTLPPTAFPVNLPIMDIPAEIAGGEEISYEKIEPGQVQGVLDEVSFELCAGHHPDHPTLPPAKLAELILETMNTIVARREAATGAQWHFSRASITTPTLAFAGDRVKFDSELLTDDGTGLSLLGTASTQKGRSLGTLTADFQLVEPGHSFS